MLVYLVIDWVQDARPVGCIVWRWSRVALVQVAAETRVNEVVIVVASTSGHRSKVIDGQLAAGVNLGQTTIPTAPVVALSYALVLGMRHTS